MKSYKGEISRNFPKNKIPKEGFQCICLSVILIDSVFRTCKNYSQECKYVVKEKNIPKYITGDVDSSSDKKNSNEKNLIKKILMKNILIKKIKQNPKIKASFVNSNGSAHNFLF